LTEAKARLSELVSDVAGTHDRVEITRNGEPAAILISPDDLFALEETIAILRDRELVDALAEADADIDAGRTIPAEQVLAELQARRQAAA
jgi:prevent-host-death family protein